MNDFFCSNYDGSGTIWPKASFPGNLFPGLSAQQRTSAKNAWEFYEQVEAYDAAVRVFYSNQGGWSPPAQSAFAQNPSLWYPIISESNRILYNRGQSLHVQACPATNWQAQRTLGIPTTPLTNVYPTTI